MGVVKFAARHTFVIDPTGKIARVYTHVDPVRHSDEVLAALDQLQKRPRLHNSSVAGPEARLRQAFVVAESPFHRGCCDGSTIVLAFIPPVVRLATRTRSAALSMMHR